jgi:hypothetical protein
MRPCLSGDLRRANRVEVIRRFYGGRVQTRAEVAQQWGRLGRDGRHDHRRAAGRRAAGGVGEHQVRRRPASRSRMRADKLYLVGMDLAEAYAIAEFARPGHELGRTPPDTGRAVRQRSELVVGYVVDCVKGVIAALPGVSPEDVAVVSFRARWTARRRLDPRSELGLARCPVPAAVLPSRHHAGSAGEPRSRPLLVVEGWVSAAFGDALLTAIAPVVKDISLAAPYDAIPCVLSRITDSPVSLGMAVLAFDTFRLP